MVGYRRIRSRHVQVPFLTFDGAKTTVDEGLFVLLTVLKHLGVKTQYSCQSVEGIAYVVADTRSFRPVIRAIKKNYRMRNLSPSANYFAYHILNGGHEREIRLFKKKNGIDNMWSIGADFHWKMRKMDEFMIEKEFSNRWGFRTVLRWPEEATNDFVQLLSEIL